MPFVRTYASVAAGVGKMKYRHFAVWNLLGVVLWAGGVTFLGYLLGNISFIANHIEALLILVVFFSLLPYPRGALAQASPRQEGPRVSPRGPRRAVRRAGGARRRDKKAFDA